MRKIKKYTGFILIIFASVIILADGKTASDGIKNGLKICSDVIIPSLFPFAVISSLAGKFNFNTNPFTRIAAKIFNIPENAVKIVLFSLIGGYPVGLKMISECFADGIITEKQAKRLMTYCVNAGPAFIINIIGRKIFSSKTAGITVLVSVVLSSVIIGIISGIADKEKVRNVCLPSGGFDFPTELITSVNGSVNTVITLCGWVIFFSFINAVVLHRIKNKTVINIISVLSEVTDGTVTAAKTGGLPLTSFCTSFGGICVAFQLYPYIMKINGTMKEYLASRLLNGAGSYFITYIITKLSKQSAECFAINNTAVSSFAPSSCILLFSFLIMLLTEIKDTDNTVDFFS